MNPYHPPANHETVEIGTRVCPDCGNETFPPKLLGNADGVVTFAGKNISHESGCQLTPHESRLMKRREFVVGAACGVAVGVAGTLTTGRLRGTPRPCIGSYADGRVSYAQQGEDLIVTDLLYETFKIDKPVYLDIGAADPVAASTTYLLYQTGGHGVLV